LGVSMVRRESNLKAIETHQRDRVHSNWHY